MLGSRAIRLMLVMTEVRSLTSAFNSRGNQFPLILLWQIHRPAVCVSLSLTLTHSPNRVVISCKHPFRHCEFLPRKLEFFLTFPMSATMLSAPDLPGAFRTDWVHSTVVRALGSQSLQFGFIIVAR